MDIEDNPSGLEEAVQPSKTATITAQDVMQRLEALEIKVDSKPKGIGDQVSKFAGLLGLVVSIATGGFTLYNNFIQKPKEDLAQAIAAINAVNQDLSSKLPAISDPAVRQSVQIVANNQKVLHIQTAERLIKRLGRAVGTPELMVLGNEKLYFGDPKTSLSYFQMAVQRAQDPIFKGEALRMQGQAMFMLGDSAGIAQARASFENALDIMSKMQNFGASGYRANLLADWTIGEAFFGSCDLAKQKLSAFHKEVVASDVLPNIGDQLRANLSTRLKQQTRCKGPQE